MKKYLKIFAPLTIAIVIGLLTFKLIHSITDSSTEAFQSGERKRPMPPPPPGRRPMPPPRDEFNPGVLERLDLSDDQQQQIASLQTDAQAASQPYLENLRTIQEQLKTISEKENFDANEAREVLNNRGQAMTELEIIRLNTSAAIKNLLTDEQKSKFDELKRRPEFGRPRGFGPPPSQF